MAGEELDLNPSAGAPESAADAGDHRGEHSTSVLSDVHAVLAEMQERGQGDIEDRPARERAPEPEREPEPAKEAEAAPNPFAASVERWGPIMEHMGIQQETALDNYMQAVVALRQDPVSTLVALAKEYAGKDGQGLLAALAAEMNVDPYEVDVETWKETAPSRAQQSELQMLRNQVVQMQMQQLKSSGNFPLLDDKDTANKIAAFMQRADVPFETAYAGIVFSSPDLQAKHSQAVQGAKAPNVADADEARRTKLRRARAADLPKGAAGERAPAPTGNRVYDDVRAIALETGFIGNG